MHASIAAQAFEGPGIRKRGPLRVLVLHLATQAHSGQCLQPSANKTPALAKVGLEAAFMSFQNTPSSNFASVRVSPELMSC